ncbi:hypothetical protein PFICI_09242 [Pestalotiopsis fici W106-1]|uniref:Uncharacterized protein n=1 Tax=Pestalotiopsis fici (strain W106-1 / CGMCC3.15140) TaxID=1229662 RepID=W3X042_PESFW|nr:uncharacterized protein PFICI_09242 [Pestalotiopsis fici W106-1]ETS79389.1 hypothetical protein PFICI_09242 [Pestalotiopsis fici W106-1]
MASSSFTFVNTTDGPALSHAAAKRMRAHVTKTNFAKRRQRLGKAPAAAKTSDAHGSMTKHQKQLPDMQRALVAGLRSGWIPPVPKACDDDSRAESLTKFWSSLFRLRGQGYPANSVEKNWQRLICSEPSLLQTTVAIELRHLAPDEECQKIADQCWSSATSILIRHISSGTVYTDAIIGTVVTMAFGERLVHNEEAWNIHMDGLTQMVNHRYEHGERRLPSWLYDLVISDATNAVLGFPRWYHRNLVKAICRYGFLAMSEIAIACDALVEVLKSIEEVQNAPPSQTSGLKEVEINKQVLDILLQARALKSYEEPSIRITATTIELILYLSWPQEPAVDCTSTADEMRQALCRMFIRPCCYSDLTSGYLMVGAIASDEGSETKKWFTSRLRDALVSVQTDNARSLREELKGEFLHRVGSMLCSEETLNDILVCRILN